MPWVLLRNSALFAVFALGMVVGVLGQPLWKVLLMEVSKEHYGQLVYKCDDAMRTHLIAKQAAVLHPSEGSISQLRAAEVALIDCQDYDLMRKRLILWGLAENELSLMGLKTIEERGKTLKDVVGIHEVRY
jgi:hypothetical protein